MADNGGKLPLLFVVVVLLCVVVVVPAVEVVVVVVVTAAEVLVVPAAEVVVTPGELVVVVLVMVVLIPPATVVVVVDARLEVVPPDATAFEFVPALVLSEGAGLPPPPPQPATKTNDNRDSIWEQKWRRISSPLVHIDRQRINRTLCNQQNVFYQSTQRPKTLDDENQRKIAGSNRRSKD